NDLLSSTTYPDNGTETSTYNALGQIVSATDRKSNTHNYSYDVLGRLTSDAWSGTTQHLDTAYDPAGNPYLFTSYASNTVVNQVTRSFDGFGQISEETQYHGTYSGTVYYTYSSGSNRSRLTSITYPGGTAINYSYNSGLDD